MENCNTSNNNNNNNYLTPVTKIYKKEINNYKTITSKFNIEASNKCLNVGKASVQKQQNYNSNKTLKQFNLNLNKNNLLIKKNDSCKKFEEIKSRYVKNNKNKYSSQNKSGKIKEIKKPELTFIDLKQKIMKINLDKNSKDKVELNNNFDNNLQKTPTNVKVMFIKAYYIYFYLCI